MGDITCQNKSITWSSSDQYVVVSSSQRAFSVKRKEC